jgi:rubrerythrin
MKRFSELSEAEVLSLAIASEAEDSDIYRAFAHKLRADYPDTADMFEAMAAEEIKHRDRLADMYRIKFGAEKPLVTRQDVRGFLKRQPIWLLDHLRIDAVRRQVASMEIESANFYKKAAAQANDPDVKRLLGNLALAEEGHEAKAEAIEHKHLTLDKKAKEDALARRMLLLQIVQPGLSGLIDGSVSTMAPIFAAAFATHNPMDAFLVGMAASVGSGISMGITEGMSDDGSISGRGQPMVRGLACGLMTTLGGLGHTLPYLIPDFWTATIIAGVFVAIELAAISWIRWKYMDTPFHSALVQVVLGGIAVLLTGILIGGS